MILLDTNAVSEPMRTKPDRNVLAWLDAQAAESLHLTTISLSELLLGIASLPTGKRRKALAVRHQWGRNLSRDRYTRSPA
jgi:hypothetical protein